MKMLDRLREETADLHRELEEENLANKIMDHSISLEEYKLLLFQNFVAYQAAEDQISKYLKDQQNDKTDRLKKDLSNLGVSDFSYALDFCCNNEAEAIGAAYVIEGSAMGGMLIGKEINNCAALNNLPPQQFFSGERNNIKSWNNYLKFIRSREFNDAEIKIAASKAKETFQLFQEAFKIQFSHY